MSVRIEVPDHTGKLVEATYTGGDWHTLDPDLLIVLEDISETVVITGYDPHPDLTIAKECVLLLNGTIAYSDKTEYDPLVIY